MQPLDVSSNAVWKQRFRAPSVAYTHLAEQAPGSGLAVSNQTGLYQLYAWDVASGQLRQLTERPEGMLGAALAPDAAFVYYLDDRQGNELGHLARFPYAAGLRPDTTQDLTPDLPAFSLGGLFLSRAGNRVAFVAGSPDGFRLYVIDLEPNGAAGPPRSLFHSQPLMVGSTLSSNGDVAVVMTVAKSTRVDFSLLAFSTASGERIGELWDGENTNLQILFFSPLPGDRRLLARTSRGGLEQLLLWNLASGERTDLAFKGVEGSTAAHDWSADGNRILFSTFNQAVQQFYVHNLATGAVTRLRHPPGNITSPYFAHSGEIFAHLEDSVRPRRLVALDGTTGEEVRPVLAAASAPAGHPWRSVSFSSTDGQMVQGWLATPPGAGPFPAIIDMIGGPGGVRVEGFSPGSLSWIDHGFAFLSLNYRGCSSFGREFETKIFGDLGHWEVEDIVAARRFLVENGIAHPEQILLTGWSYGGYLTLMSLGLYPDLWAGGMAGIAIADWAIQYEDTADMLRGFQVALLGGTPQEKPEQYARSSPITYAERVKAPLLIIQGRNDTRTPARPMEMYVDKLKALGRPVEIEWFDTGHLGSLADVELGIRHQEHMLHFAYRVLG